MKVLIPETTFTGVDATGDAFYTILDDILINAEKITVIFDGVKYENVPVRSSSDEFKYGAVFNSAEDAYDFSNYPFSIVSYKHGGK